MWGRLDLPESDLRLRVEVGRELPQLVPGQLVERLKCNQPRFLGLGTEVDAVDSKVTE